MSDTRKFKCAECTHIFEQEAGSGLRCPECRGRTLILLEGPSLKGAKSCGGNCSCCSSSCGGD